MRYRTGGLICCTICLWLFSACFPMPDLTQPLPTTNLQPVADAGNPQIVKEQEAVELDGSRSSDPDGDPLVYQWRQLSGPPLADGLVNAGTAKAIFRAPQVDADTTLAFQLTVDDGNGGRSAATVTVQVRAVVIDFQPLVALAGEDQGVAAGSVVTLNGSYQGGTGEVYYHWMQHPLTGGPDVELSATNVPSPTFTAPEPDIPEVLNFILTVVDETAANDSDEVQIVVAAKLIVDAGEDQIVLEGTEVALEGGGYGGLGDRTYRWEQTAGPNVVLADPNTFSTTFTAPDVDESTVLTFELTATDAENYSVTDAVDIQVVPELTASAGDDQTATPGFEVTLEGAGHAGSGDMTYAWLQTAGQAVELSDANAASPTFTAPLVESDETLTFQLTVTDETSATATDTVDILVDAPRVRFGTTMGEFVILLRPDVAPVGVANFMMYVNLDFYTGLIMHRIIPDFVAQGGGWTADLGQTYRYDPIVLESNNGLYNARSWVAYARTSDPNSATSEFFVNLVDNTAEGEAQFGYTNLDYISPEQPGYAVFGRVVEGMDVIDAMAQVETHSQAPEWNPEFVFDDVPVEPIVLTEVTVE